MKFRKGMALLALVGAYMAGTAGVEAATVTPSSIAHTLSLGQTASNTVTVSFDPEGAAFNGVDVMFLCDTTGSMGGVINTMKTYGTQIMNNVSAYNVAPGVPVDAQFGAASYRDVPTYPWGSYGDYSYRIESAIGTTAAAQAGMNTWYASGGYDWPESGLIALYQMATNPAAGWTDDKKIVVWMGDAPSHYPGDGSSSSTYPGPTEAQVISALQAANITVVGVGSNSGFDYYGQASRITSATGGSLYYTGSSSAAQVASSITSLITSELQTINNLSLVPFGDTNGFTTSITPGSYSSITIDPATGASRSFGVGFTGTTSTPGTYTYELRAIADGATVGTVDVSITVPGGSTSVPEPATIFLLGSGMAGVFAMRKKFRK